MYRTQFIYFLPLVFCLWTIQEHFCDILVRLHFDDMSALIVSSNLCQNLASNRVWTSNYFFLRFTYYADEVPEFKPCFKEPSMARDLAIFKSMGWVTLKFYTKYPPRSHI